jgi:hypothetical protein
VETWESLRTASDVRGLDNGREVENSLVPEEMGDSEGRVFP